MFIINYIKKYYPNVQHIYIFAHEKNNPSLRIIKKLGFEFVGFLRKDLLGRYIPL
jgi:RimJ/RimL family protein N-acetyltransferase